MSRRERRIGRVISRAATFERRSALLLMCWLMTGSVVVGQDDAPRGESARANGPTIPAPQQPLGQPADTPAPAITRLVRRLDSPAFSVRSEAMRELSLLGNEAVPYLVDSLHEGSSESRYRAHRLLVEHQSLQQVAPYLIARAQEGYSRPARLLAIDLAHRQLDESLLRPATDQLLRFWSTNSDAFRTHAMARLEAAQSAADLAQAVARILSLDDDAAHFATTATRLEAMSIAHDQSYTAGYVILAALARGLGEDRPELTAIADSYVAALESLRRDLQWRAERAQEIRQEITGRADWCRSATDFLVRLTDPNSPQYPIVTRRIGVSPDCLREIFWAGFRSPDQREYAEGVGSVHLIDMLGELLEGWPDAPADGAIGRIVAGVKQAALDGEKEKGLAYFDALEACRKMVRVGIAVVEGPGQLLAERLGQAAAESPDKRSYQPLRNSHDRFVALLECGVLPQDRHFPVALWDSYLHGGRAVSEVQRAACDRYVQLLNRLGELGLDRREERIDRFLTETRDCLAAHPQSLRERLACLERLASECRVDGGVDVEAVATALAKWTERTESEEP